MKRRWRALVARVPVLAWAGAALGALGVMAQQADQLEQREQVQAKLAAQQQALAPVRAREAQEPNPAEQVQRHQQAQAQAHERQRSWPALTQADALWLALQGWLVQQGLQVREWRAEAAAPAQPLPTGAVWRSVHLSVQGPLAAWRGVWAAWMDSGWWWRMERMTITPLSADQVLVQASWSLALRDGEPLPDPVVAALPAPQPVERPAPARPDDDTALRWVGWWQRGETREAVLVQGAQWLRVPVGALVGSSGLRLREASAQTLVLVRENAPGAAPLVLQWSGQEKSP